MSRTTTFVLCGVMFALAFTIDLLTPQELVAAILLTAPVALSSLLLDRRITAGFVIAALAANIVAGYFNGVSEGHHWNAIAIGNRALAGFSIILVAVLGALAQAAATNAGVLSAQQRQADRGQALRRAMEVIRSSLNVELVARAIVREAMAALGVSGARLCTIDNSLLGAATYSYDPVLDDVTVSHVRPSAEVLSLIQRTMDERRVLTIDRSDALSRFALDTLQAARAFFAPLVNDQVSFGVLILLVHEGDVVEPDVERWVSVFAEQATVAAAQASLFVELADKNAALLQAKKTEEERAEVIRDLVYALSHDLRTPLAAAAMTTQQALDGKYGPLPEAHREILRRALTSNEELRRLAETLLLVARYESGEQSTVRRPVLLRAVASGVCQELQPIWHAKNQTVTLEGDADVTVLGDEGEIRRAVMNLVANAIEWTPEGGSVVIGIAIQDRRAILRISDTGYGVNPELREHLFERLAADRPRVGAGSGLGLYIVRRIAENHGGAVWYESSPAGGSTFVLELPLAESTAAAPALATGSDG